MARHTVVLLSTRLHYNIKPCHAVLSHQCKHSITKLIKELLNKSVIFHCQCNCCGSAMVVSLMWQQCVYVCVLCYKMFHSNCIVDTTRGTTMSYHTLNLEHNSCKVRTALSESEFVCVRRRMWKSVCQVILYPMIIMYSQRSYPALQVQCAFTITPSFLATIQGVGTCISIVII